MAAFITIASPIFRGLAGESATLIYRADVSACDLAHSAARDLRDNGDVGMEACHDNGIRKSFRDRADYRFQPGSDVGRHLCGCLALPSTTSRTVARLEPVPTF